MPRHSVGLAKSPIQGVSSAISRGEWLKKLWHEADHSAKVRNDESIPPFPHMFLGHNAELSRSTKEE
jgi:hypothetical protein